MVKVLGVEIFFVSLLAIGTLGSISISNLIVILSLIPSCSDDDDDSWCCITPFCHALAVFLFASLTALLYFILISEHCLLVLLDEIVQRGWDFENLNQSLRFLSLSCSDCVRSRCSARSVALVSRQEASPFSAPSLDILMTLSFGDALNFGFEFGFDVAFESLALARISCSCSCGVKGWPICISNARPGVFVW